MADAKKPDKGKPGAKPAAGGGGGPSIETTLAFVALIGAMIVFIIFPAVAKVFGFSSGSIIPPNFTQTVTDFFASFVSVTSYISIFLCLMFVCGIVYCNVMYGEVRRKQLADLEPAVDAKPIITAPGPGNLHVEQAGPDPRWRDIEGLMQSSNSADWRVAILEADIMLEDMLTQMGYQGDSIGDKLKSVDSAHFKTLQDAWRAHKVRNTIAHEGASYQLSRSEADQTIALFKNVFDEFYFV